MRRDNHQEGTAGAVRRVYFISSRSRNSKVGNGCSHPTGVGLAVILFGPGWWRFSGAVVLLFQALLLWRTAAHGDAWHKWNVDGGDWPGCRLSGCGKWPAVPDCAVMSPFSVRDAGGFGDLFCDFSQRRCVSRSPCRVTGSVVKFYGDFRRLHTDSCRHCRGFINRHDL